MSKLKQCATMIAFVFVSVIMLTACGAKSELTLSTQNGVLTAKPGGTIQFETEIKSKDDKDKDKAVTYKIKSGQDYGSINAVGGLLTVKNDAPAGAEIVVVSTLNAVTSNEIKIEVASIPLEEIIIETNKNTIIKGGYANLTVELIPENTTQREYSWIIIEGEQEASIDGNKIFINDDANSEAEIIVKAISGTIESNTITFVVAKASEEVLHLSFTNETIVLDINDPAAQPKLEAVIYDGTFTAVKDREIRFAIEEGEDLIKINSSGYSASFEILGHGTATVSAMIWGTEIEEFATIKVIVPPENFELPEVFEGKSSYHYAKGSEGSLNEMPFNIAMTKLEGKNSVAQKYNVTFEHDGVLDNSAATYNQTATSENAITGNITFNKTGRIKAIVQSDSGSKVETKREFMFNINEGVNITTFEQLREVLEDYKLGEDDKLDFDYKPFFDNIPLNITVLDKVRGLNGEEFGYSLVPAQSDDPSAVRITVKSNFDKLTIYGNDHSIDTSKLRKFNNEASHIGSLIDFDCGALVGKIGEDGGRISRFGIDIFDLHFLGNTGVADTPIAANGRVTVKGVYEYALRIGRDNRQGTYGLNIKNVTFTGFNKGMVICHAVNSVVEDVKVNNINATGIEVSASKITFKDMVFGICGATGIEISPDNYEFSGNNFDQKQEVNFAGTFESTNYNDGDTKYFLKWGEVMGGALANLISGFEFNFRGMLAANFGSHEDNGTDNVYQLMTLDDGEEKYRFVFVALIFNDFSAMPAVKQNNSVVNYLNFDSNGIIDIAEMEKFNNTHQYVTMTINLNEVGEVGKVLLLNLNYGKPDPAPNPA